MSGGAYLRRTWCYLELQFRGEVTQTRMLRWAPDRLLVGYTRTMLAALWLQPAPKRIGIIGLGGGAQAKFCYRHLPQARIEVVEAEASVLALRREFRIPDDDARLQVEHGDGAAWLRGRRGQFDLLLVDAYDIEGIPDALVSQAFYDDCQQSLTADGVMASNLYDTDVRQHCRRLRRSFDSRVVRLEEPRESNAVVIAWNGRPQPVGADAALSRLPWRARGQLGAGFHRLQQAWARRQPG